MVLIDYYKTNIWTPGQVAAEYAEYAELAQRQQVKIGV